ncbi:MAG: ATP-binding protein [Pseudomonadota bacterium]
MGFSGFALRLALRLTALLLAVALTAALAIASAYPTAAFLTLLLCILLTFELIRFVSRTNQELARFFDAARYADYGQRFELGELGSGFRELGETFTEILNRFSASRGEQEANGRRLKALLEHVPVPLISLYSDGRVQLWNNAARRFFAAHKVARLEDLANWGDALPERLTSLEPGERALVPIQLDGMAQTITLSASAIVTSGTTEKLASLQNIQTELDGMQLAAWEDLVRVLTHEIMNSLTPVSSLARTAADLVTDVRNRLADEPALVRELDDVQDAVATLARRADGLTAFVGGYRQLLGVPQPERSRFEVAELFDDVARITGSDWADVALTKSVTPTGLEIVADRRMLEQVLINLLQNARQAMAQNGGTQLTLTARLNARGRVSMEICDEGPGISEAVAARMFVPFYTTRKEGTGVGLALSRQIVNAHGGNISHSTPPSGGACFTIVI